MVTFHIITLFPDIVSSYCNESMLKRAKEKKLIDIKVYNPRDFTNDKHHTTDDRPYGGGPGMVMKAQPILKAVQKAVGRKKDVKIIILSPSGKQFDNTTAAQLAKKHKHIVLIAGHYEGIDVRVKKILKAQEISIGPFILTGGELPALVLVDSVARHIKGVLGNEISLEEKRVATSEVYTRPEVLKHKNKTYTVPKVLLSGDHKEIERWKANQ